MKRFMWILAVSFLVLIPFGTNAQAQPKEVTETFTMTFYVTPKMLPLDEGRVRVNHEAFGIILSDTGSGLFHGATLHVLGGFTVEKGKYTDEQDWGVYTLPNGDKVFFTATATGEMTLEGGGQGKLTGTITGGTGKCAGIKGSSSSTRYSLRPAIQGIAQTYNKGTIRYTLP